MLNNQLEIVGDESMTSLDHYKGLYVNLLFDRSIYRPMCTHVGLIPSATRQKSDESKTKVLLVPHSYK